LKEFSALVEHGDSSDEVGIRDVGVAFGDIDVTIARVRDDVGWVRQRFGRISSHARFTKGKKHFTLGTEFDDHASFVLFCASIGHPNIPIPINVNAMRPYEHSAAKASDLFAGFVEMVNRIRIGPKAAWRSPR